MVSLAPLLSLPCLEEDLARVEKALLANVRTGDPFLAEVASHLITAGGKRLRPALAVAVGELSGGPADDDVIMGAVAVELVHLGSLYHDDVIDEAATRRGVDSVNARWGNLVAILAGDFLLARASEIAASLGTEVAGLLATTIGALCQGELRELQRVFDVGRTEEQYVAAVAGKTASLFATACRIGGIVGGLDRRAVEAAPTFGDRLGMAFQVVDDLIDLVGDVRVTGKAPGTDLREGVFTAPLLLAAERDAAFAEMLASGDRNLENALGVLRSTEALHDAFEMAESFGEAAISSLSELPEDEWTLTLEKVVKGVLAQLPEPQLR